MVTATLQKEEFHGRLQRIAQGGPNTLGQLMAGPADTSDEARKSTKKSRRVARPARERRGPTNPLGALLGGILIGGLAVVAVRYARFRLTGEALGGPDADILLAVDIIFAMTLAIMFRTLFRARSRLHGFGKLLGVGAMALSMHNLVYYAPGVFSQAFSAQWVESVKAQTNPNSLLIAGQSIALPRALPGV